MKSQEIKEDEWYFIESADYQSFDLAYCFKCHTNHNLFNFLVPVNYEQPKVITLSNKKILAEVESSFIAINLKMHILKHKTKLDLPGNTEKTNITKELNISTLIVKDGYYYHNDYETHTLTI